ncbi:DUF1990 domain-containing protein [Zafaria cholistanensis]|uniref:DUF1990 domain-containing protein n=1 Tax=Zafaria cholistanensis TaxID=1682741 RepID=A0A5A7NL80_9MICC|nr:DUF1990 domain-containing protein [Zafaria cholistanensis]GER21655.1 DUF1990 domain-containing protein [Zafaria cholistanensis]
MPHQPLDQQGFSYSEVGATRGPLPDGYQTVVQRRVLGRGGELFRTAAERLLTWEMHRGAGIRVPASTPRAAPGLSVELRLGPGRFAIAAGCRVVYVIDEPRRQGFAYGTLHGHPERGEERFCLDWHDDGTVEFTITAFSVPAFWWVRAAGLLARWIQRAVTGRYLRALEGGRSGGEPDAGPHAGPNAGPGDTPGRW